MPDPQNKKRMKLMLMGVAIVFGTIFLYKTFIGLMFSRMLATQKPVATVSAMKIDYQLWQPKIIAAGSLRAVRGVDVTTEVDGLVRTIEFVPGAHVKKDTLLVTLNTDADIAHLNALRANEELAKTTYKRDLEQFSIQAISKATLDTDAANLKNFQSQVAEQEAIINKKMIRAPFDGFLGVSNVNPGQNLKPGDSIVTLQSLNPIYVDFFVPQQKLVQLSKGLEVKVTTDAFPQQIFDGQITTINPKVDPATRNVQIEVTLKNKNNLLLPGMYATAEVDAGAATRYLTLPQTAISYNPYGDIVYVVKETGKDAQGKAVLTVFQNFVVVGDTRGDQVAITKGLKQGDTVVTAGQHKLKNGSHVSINNEVQPSNNPSPQFSDR